MCQAPELALKKLSKSKLLNKVVSSYQTLVKWSPFCSKASLYKRNG